MQLAESNPEMAFELLTKELQIKEDEVEPFIIEVLKTNLVRVRMDQKNRKVHISSTMHRTFGRPQWQQLHDLLCLWKNNMGVVESGMRSVAAAQKELLKQK